MTAADWLSVAADLLDPAGTDTGHAALEAEPLGWLRAMFPDHVTAPFAPHHCELWAWAWAIEANQAPDDAFVGIWARGGAKSESAELAVCALGARRRRRYALYVSDTQEQADDHVANIAALLESESVATRYPALGQRRVGKYGNARGWRRNRLVTHSGLVVDALGLDTAARGVKFEDDRPDLIVFDDLDAEDDTPAATAQKIDRITKKLLPAGAPHLAVLAIQNLVIPDGVFARLADGRADFLARRTVSGPIPAVRGLVVEERPDAAEGESRWRVVAGEPTWEGQNLAVVQGQIDRWGYTAFLSEAQHDVGAPPGGMYDHVSFSHCAFADLPDMVRTTVWVDPAVTDTDASDAHAYCADGLGTNGTVYRLETWEGRTSPEDSLRRAIRAAIRHGAREVGVETDQGGDTWRSVFREAWRAVASEDQLDDSACPLFTQDKAGRQKAVKRGQGTPSKAGRNAQMLADYERAGRIVHVIDHPAVPADATVANLERSLRRFPRTKPFDLADAAFWSWHDLRAGGVNQPPDPDALHRQIPSTSGTSYMTQRRPMAGALRSGRI